MTPSLPVPSTDAIRLAQGNETLVDALALFDVGIDCQNISSLSTTAFMSARGSPLLVRRTTTTAVLCARDSFWPGDSHIPAPCH